MNSGDNVKNNDRLGTALVSMVAMTHIHPGVGQTTGAIDLPVSRERATQYPFIPGSGVKGAFRVWARERAGLDEDVKRLFGDDDGGGDSGGVDGAGGLLCSDARLLLLPVRCVSDAYKLVTCPAILKRFRQDCGRAGIALDMKIDAPDEKKYFGVEANDDVLGLEEREFGHAGRVDDSVVSVLSGVVEEEELKSRLVVLSDRDFTWFARYALPVMARNVLNENKISENLWYEESLAPETVMYLLFGERKSGCVFELLKAVDDRTKYIQIGGNETIGQGWFEMSVYERGQS